MKKYKEIFIPIFFLVLSFMIILPVYDFAKSKKQTFALSLEDFEETGTIQSSECGFLSKDGNNYYPNYYPITTLYPDALGLECRHKELYDIFESLNLNFYEREREYIENYSIRTIKSPFPNYDNYKPIFYDIPVTGHKILPDLMDKEHKIAIVFQKYQMYHLDDPKSDIKEEKTGIELVDRTTNLKGKILYTVDTEILDESTVRKENKFFQDLIENADSSMKVKKPFQNQDNYTVIYIERGFCQIISHNYKRQKEFLIPYLEKAFESLGYSKIEEK